MSDFTGDMTSAVEAAFAASSSPEPATTTTVETPAPSASETATTDVSQAATTTPATTTTQEPGPIPYPRFKEVNDKWTTASKELEGLGWAKGVNPQLAQSAIQLLTRAQQNPLAFTEELEALRDHPQFGPQLRSWAARTLGFRNPSRPESVEETMPEPDLVFEDGRRAYSAEAQAKRDQFLLKQFESKLDERISPLAEKGKQVDQIVAEKAFAKIDAESKVTAKTEIDELKEQYPQFWEHREAVAAVMEAKPRYTLQQAWAEVFVKEVGPKLAGQQAAAVTKKVQAGSGSANPSRPSGATPKPAEGFKEALEQAFGVTSHA